jgi:RNA polymerase sigma factor (sigma-70 family)
MKPRKLKCASAATPYLRPVRRREIARDAPEPRLLEVAFVVRLDESYAHMKSPGSGAPTDEFDEFRIALDSESRQLFEAAFRAHHAGLVQYLRHHVGNDADARDIAQETYLRLLRYRESQDLDSLKALLFRIATNLLAMRRRTARAQRWAHHRPVDEEIGLLADEPSHDQRLASERQLDRLMEVIKRLPPKCQQVFVLSRFHDMTYLEIAKRCGISVKMVEKHIAKALGICRIEVGEELQSTFIRVRDKG